MADTGLLEGFAEVMCREPNAPKAFADMDLGCKWIRECVHLSLAEQRRLVAEALMPQKDMTILENTH